MCPLPQANGGYVLPCQDTVCKRRIQSDDVEFDLRRHWVFVSDFAHLDILFLSIFPIGRPAS